MCPRRRTHVVMGVMTSENATQLGTFASFAARCPLFALRPQNCGNGTADAD
jgi:hypothetical protein